MRDERVSEERLNGREGTESLQITYYYYFDDFYVYHMTMEYAWDDKKVD